MARGHPVTRLSRARAAALREHLDVLIDGLDRTARLDADPIAFPKRYPDPADQEIAALYAGLMAFGRVDLFRPFLAAWFDWLDAGGGPRARTLDFSLADAEPLLPLYYRWVRGPHLVVLMRATAGLLREHGTLEAAFATDGDVRDHVLRGCDALRAGCVEAAPEVGLDVSDASELPRGLLHLLATPRGNSACKRWNMILRWLVRPGDDGVDLGLWSTLTPADLVIPVDTHVLRVSRFLGLTRRPDASWRTAVEITDNLRRLDPDDPIRFDFALAHLGISGACLGRRDAEVCPACPLDGVCRA